MKTLICPGCGAGLDAGVRICRKCGRSVPESRGPASPSAPPPSRTGGTKVPVALIAIFALGLLALLGVLTMMRSSPPPGGGPAPAPPASPAATAPVAAAPASPPQAVSAVPPAPAPPAAAPRSPAVASPRSPRPSTREARPTGAPGEPPAAAPAAEKSVPISKTYECRESAVFNVDPEEAEVTVDGHRIGTADDWDDAGGGKKYKFQGPGTHIVKLSLKGYETMWLKFVVRPDAEHKTADVDLDMKKSHK